MRRFVKLSLLGLAAGASACSTPDLVHPTEVLPYAGVRFINAVPDTGGAFGFDFRFVDLLESNAHFRITFRNQPGTFQQGSGNPVTNVSTAIQFKGAREGSRHFRVFLDDTLQTLASSVLVDNTQTLAKGQNYTAMLWGNARSAATTGAGAGGDKMALSFWEEDVTVTTAGKVKMRVINATSAALDVYTMTNGSATPATPTWANVPAYSRSTYVEVDSGTYAYVVRNAGGVTNLINAIPALYGQLPTCSGRTCATGQFPDIEALPGTRVAGSAISGIVFPPTATAARAPTFAATGLTFVWDKRPPRTCDPYC